MGVDPLSRGAAVFLDRDGVINRAVVRDRKPYPPASAADLEILPGVAEALDRFRAAGLSIVVVTNQPDVARGRQTRAAVEAIHAALREQLGLRDIRVCYHDDDDRCSCRKPAPGLLLDAAAEGNIDLRASVMVGDRGRDVEAGRRAGCATVLIDYQYDEPAGVPDFRAASLLDASAWILEHAGARDNTP